MQIFFCRCSLFQDELSFLRAKLFKEQIMSKNKYISIFSCKIEVFIILKIFCNTPVKCLQTAYCLLRGMFSFECCLVWLYGQINIPFFCNNHNTLPLLELNFKWRLIIVEVRFENWGISFAQFQLGDIQSSAAFRPIMQA